MAKLTPERTWLAEVASVAVAAWDDLADDFVRDGHGLLVHARLDEPGMLVAQLARGGSDVAHIDPKRLLHDAFEAGDTWFVTGDFMRVDTLGDYWYVEPTGNVVNAIYGYPGVALCVAEGRFAAIQLHPRRLWTLDHLETAAVAGVA